MRKSCEAASNFPGWVGYLDGMDVALKWALTFHGEIYIGRKRYTELKMQVVCDSSLRFTYLSTGYPSAVGDPAVFAVIYLFCKSSMFFSQSEEYLLADKIYHCTWWCLTPYKSPVIYSNRRNPSYTNYDFAHAVVEVRIEHAFSGLKDRFRSLHGLKINIYDSQGYVRAIA